MAVNVEHCEEFVGMKRSLIIGISLVITASSAYAQLTDIEALARPNPERYSFDITGSGPRAKGMGGAFIGVSDDLTAFNWNPAGLVGVEDPVMSVSYRRFSTGGTYDFGGLGASIPAREFSHDAVFGGISSANFAAPLRIKGHEFIGAVALTRHTDEFQSTGLDLLVDTVFLTNINGQINLDTLSVEQRRLSEIRGSISSVNFGFGTRVYKNISAGLALNIYMGQTQRLSSVVDVVNNLSVFDPFGQEADFVSNTQIVDTNKWSGLNLSLGGKIDGERLDLGLVIRTPFSLKSNVTRSVFVVTTRNGLTFEDASDTTYFIDGQVLYQMPLVIAGGVGFKLNETTTLALDAEFRNFGGSSAEIRDELIINPDGSNESFTTEDTTVEWNSVFTVRGGVEKFFDTDFGRVPVRAGASVVPFPNPITTFDQTTLTIGESTPVQYNFSVGAGMWWSQIKFDMSYTYSTLTIDDGIGENRNRNHLFAFGFTGVF